MKDPGASSSSAVIPLVVYVLKAKCVFSTPLPETESYFYRILCEITPLIQMGTADTWFLQCLHG